MPSSSASVAETPSSSPSTSRRSMSRRCAACSRRGTARAASRRRSSRSAVKRCMSSAALRLFAKQSVRRPRSTSAAWSLAASPSARAAQPELGVEQRRVPEDDRPLGARRRVVGDHVTGSMPSRRVRELAGVGDRRRGEQELRLGAVDARHPAQAPQDVGDVRAEDAAVDVRLVDDDVAQVREHVAPALVVAAARRRGACRGWSGSAFAHLRICQRCSLRRVAVVDRRPQRAAPRARSACGPGPARAPSSGRGRARGSSASRASASRTGRLKASVLPDAVPVVTTRCSPRAAASQAARLVHVQLARPLRCERARRASGRARPGAARSARRAPAPSCRCASSSPARRSAHDGSIRLHEDRPRRVDARQVGAGRRDDHVECTLRNLREHGAGAFRGASPVRRDRARRRSRS